MGGVPFIAASIVVINGVMCSIFAYGQTGSGKTHTMSGAVAAQWHSAQEFWNAGPTSGAAEYRGLIQRTFEYLFVQIDRAHHLVSISCIRLRYD